METNSQSKPEPKKKGIAGWLKVLIAVVVICLIGAVVYYGVTGELFQGKSFKTRSVCGNGILERGEICDDGNVKDGDKCSSDCQSMGIPIPVVLPGEAKCGNGVVEGVEECDDGNREDNDGCTTNCLITTLCGNGVVDQGETCDDGNTLDGDSCSSDCMIMVIDEELPDLFNENPPEDR